MRASHAIVLILCLAISYRAAPQQTEHTQWRTYERIIPAPVKRQAAPKQTIPDPTRELFRHLPPGTEIVPDSKGVSLQNIESGPLTSV